MEIEFTNLLKDAPAVLPRGPHGFTREEVETSQRNRLMVAFIELAAERGYHELTVQEIVTRAGTAKGAFYASFKDKEDCFLQTFDMGAVMLLQSVVGAVDVVDDPAERIEVGVRAYVQTLIDFPALVRVFLVESVGAGGKLMERWMFNVDLLAAAIVEWRRESRIDDPGLQSLNQRQVTAAIAGINQLTWMTAQREGIDALTDLADELVALTAALLSAPFGEVSA